ncbi:DUF6483 family protein [Romboutsia sp.]|uniref:DUF6483 family protein n=1 Tax=Romboutsia sp. TaxID=1965302 RepID=UPI003F403EB5
MGIKNDWLLDQIENLTLLISKVFFKKSTAKYELESELNNTDCDLLYNKLSQLILQGQICEGEDLLYKSLDTTNIKYLEIAVDFYESLNLLSDDELEKVNFSREEINEGLAEILVRYNIDLKQFNINNQYID